MALCSWCPRGQNTSRAKSTSTQSQIPSVEMGAHEGALLMPSVLQEGLHSQGPAACDGPVALSDIAAA